MLPVRSWRPGWALKSLNKARLQLGMANTIEGYLPKIFPHFGLRSIRFTGKREPMPGLIPVPGWSDFNKGVQS